MVMKQASKASRPFIKRSQYLKPVSAYLSIRNSLRTGTNHYPDPYNKGSYYSTVLLRQVTIIVPSRHENIASIHMIPCISHSHSCTLTLPPSKTSCAYRELSIILKYISVLLLRDLPSDVQRSIFFAHVTRSVSYVSQLHKAVYSM